MVGLAAGVIGAASGLAAGGVLTLATRYIPQAIFSAAIAQVPGDAFLQEQLAKGAARAGHGWRTCAIVLTTTLAVVASAIKYAEILPAAVAVGLFVVVLVGLAWIDGETHLLPDVLTMPLLLLGLVVNIDGLIVTWWLAVAGALTGYGAIRVSAAGFAALTGRPDGIGLGDAKLLGALGAWLGLWAIPSLFLAAAALAMLSASLRCVVARSTAALNTPHPFGPYLATAGIVAMLAR